MTAIATSFYANNFLSLPGAAPLTPSHQETAELGAIIPLHAGSSTLQRFGSYSDVISRDYVVQIDSVSGAAINQATFRWSDTGGATWNDDLIGIIQLAPFTLSHGIGINWLIGTGTPQHVMGDLRRFTAYRLHPVGALIDLRRDYEYRSGPVANGAVVTIPWDFGVQRTPTHLIIHDQNFLSTTTTRLQLSESTTFSPLEYNQVVPWAPSKLIFALPSPSNSRYGRLHLTAGTGQGEVRIGEWYLGDALTMSRSFSGGYSEEEVLLSPPTMDQLTRGPAPLGLKSRQYELRWGLRTLAGGDIAKLETLDTLTYDQVNRVQKPFWLYQDAERIILELVQSAAALRKNRTASEVYEAFQTLVQVVRTAD